MFTGLAWRTDSYEDSNLQALKTNPSIEYRFSSTGGDIPLGKSDLEKPLILDMKSRHGDLCLCDYIETLTSLIKRNNFLKIKKIAGENLKIPSGEKEHINKIIIKSEKLGAFYNIASITLFYPSKTIKIAASSACTYRGRLCLEEDFSILRDLDRKFGFRHIPSLYCLDTRVPVPGKEDISFSIALSEWYEGYWEWHFSVDREENRIRIVVWDTLNGSFFLDKQQEEELFRIIAYIHTSYYDCATGNQIYLWHNSAGDFIVKQDGRKTEVKLTTVRKYGVYLSFIKDIHENSAAALIYFFLDLSVRMRVDRLDGTGKAIIADRRFLKPVIKGFLEAIDEKSQKGIYTPMSSGQFITLLSGMTVEELTTLFKPLEGIYMEEGNINMPFLTRGFSEHISELHEAFQMFIK